MRRHIGKAFFFGLCLTVLSGSALAAPDIRSADRVVIEKSRRQMTLYSGERQVARYYVALGKQPVGRKRCQGDLRTPEGTYAISGRKPNSDFYRALRISYPSEDDVARAREAGCDPGGDIMIHGLRPGSRENLRKHLLTDWTHGCVAVTNDEIEQIWAMVPDGTPVDIRP